MLAILLPYAVDQNEPSKPVKHLVEVPTEKKHRDDVLKQLFVKHVCLLDSDEIKDIKIKKGGEKSYGDLVVSWQDDQFLFVTFVDI
jgi:hypothetical protein